MHDMFRNHSNTNPSHALLPSIHTCGIPLAIFSAFPISSGCPHCRGDLFPIDADDLAADTHPLPGHYLFIFSSMATLQNDIEEIAYDLFVNLPLSPRPADLNWDQIRA